MRIYAVADLHGRAERIRQIGRAVRRLRPDALIAAGDITGFFRPGPVIEALNGWGIPVLAVRGNTDVKRVDNLLAHHTRTCDLHLRAVEMKGIRFVGISGAVPVPFRTRIRFREKAVLERAAALTDRQTVLVVHPPPRGTLDEVGGRFHAGSSGVKALVEACRPLAVICGHIHERPGIAVMGQTLVVNCAVARNGSGALIECPEGGPPTARML
ncbi:metallophosphoesterase [Desulfonema ishimotonii]|uniref:Metallophosphoesterase n=1 Tax=Desulfonema ishimotonii TaxID=45657 RepID=A0A401G263_9BACT|nr:metallophosphoesterase family protein [Desulfonema ishimotonii]GBC63319.1 metallophosphoesterase [Desulfonema ishimotonii]